MIYYTADLHFGHGNIISYSGRPFADTAEMDTELVNRWNARVAADDVVYVLGDIHLGPWRDTVPLIGSLNGVILLLPGNHDGCWPGHRKGVENWRSKYRAAGITSVTDRHVIRRHPLPLDAPTDLVDLAHFPYDDDHPSRTHRDTRHREHWPADEGRWLFHGHVHEGWKIWPERRMINVGVDQWDYAPVSEMTLLEIVRSHQP